ncbi:MAG: hypothetical protein PHD37_10815 [Gallionellaceae bacterium]|nr:hypothetical protein [Gallionellaceae bacterium]
MNKEQLEQRIKELEEQITEEEKQQVKNSKDYNNNLLKAYIEQISYYKNILNKL